MREPDDARRGGQDAYGRDRRVPSTEEEGKRARARADAGSRSRSPGRRSGAAEADEYRSRSPHHGRRHHHSRHEGPHDANGARSRPSEREDRHRLTVFSHLSKQRHRYRSHKPTSKVELPFEARTLSKRDFDAFQPLFGYYLDIQKGLQMSDLDSNEVRGRWKSFLGKWNRGELSEGWYDPERFQHCATTWTVGEEAVVGRRNTFEEVDNDDLQEGRGLPPVAETTGLREQREGADSDDDYGPILPPGQRPSQPSYKRGPGIPTFQDLEAKRETDDKDRQSRIDDTRLAHKADRAEQRERLDDLVPRAEAGTRERQLEKKRALNDKLKGFREKSPGGVGEVPEQDLLGGGDGIDDFKKMIASQQRKKTDREVRREEIARARAKEREEKLMEYRAREEEKMTKLKELARLRFG